MPTWGYAIVAALIAVLAGYTLWPASGSGDGIAVFPGAIAEPFTVTGTLGEQRIEGGRVKVAGMDRPVNAEAMSGFAAGATALKVAPDRVVDDVDAKAAQAWGIDGSRHLVVGEEERQWGEADGTGAVWDPIRRRVFLVEAERLRQLAQAAARLDNRALLELPQTSNDWLLVDGVRLGRKDGEWRFPGDLRPTASGRVERIIAALRGVQLTGPGGAPPEAEPVHELRLAGVGGIEERVRLLRVGERLWIERVGSPAQELGAEAAHWLDLVAALREDRPLDPHAVGEPNAITVTRAGHEIFRLARRGTYGEDGQKPWEVRWSGGAEPAAKDAGERIQTALLGLVFHDVTRGDALLSPDATTIELTPEFGTSLRIIIGGGRACSSGWIGTLNSLPPVLADLRPDACLDLHPCPFELARVVKLQRRWTAQPARDEVHARAAGGSWARTFPADATPADALAVGRLARSLVRLRATSVRLATPDERAATATAEIAVRIAPVKVNMTGAEDEVDLDDTVPQERAWRLHHVAQADRLYPVGDTWLMVDAVGGLAFTIDAADAEALLADVASTRLFPIAPALVSAIEIAGSTDFRLEHRGADWMLRSNGGEAPADALATRRLLRALAALDSRGPAKVPAGAAVAIVIETVDGERLTAHVHATSTDGVIAATDHGGVQLDPDAWAQVALDPATYRVAP
jgi:hypothetical protein